MTLAAAASEGSTLFRHGRAGLRGHSGLGRSTGGTGAGVLCEHPVPGDARRSPIAVIVRIVDPWQFTLQGTLFIVRITVTGRDRRSADAGASTAEMR